ncbi:MAG: GNAT family N-acetyltransferase [Oscillospiraceae bacterium]
MVLREYRSTDCPDIIKLFYDTVHSVNAKDYTREQLDIWAPENIDAEKWDKSLSEHYTLVALIGDKIVGFGDIDDTGYLDRLYVHKNYQRKGIAEKICNKLEIHSDAAKITVHSSVTAKGFFANRGYNVIKSQIVIRNSIKLTNYVMEKQAIS